jgi:hypothetical protein
MLDPHKVPLPLSDAHREWFENNNAGHHLSEGGVIHTRMQDEGHVSDEGAVDYSSWTVVDLKTEIERRNSEMGDDDEPLSTSGKKDELVARLTEDDEALAGVVLSEHDREGQARSQERGVR